MEEGYYPHFHINGGHGDPHIWFFLYLKILKNVTALSQVNLYHI